MNSLWQYLDLSLILVVAVLVSGVILLFDWLSGASARRGGVDEKQLGASKEPVVVEYAHALFPVLLIVLVLRSFIVEPFRIPSGSMMPTLLVGDFILVNKFAYGIRLPVINTLVYPMDKPKQGDVVVFRFPLEPSTAYIKRVIGVPGDRVAYFGKHVYLNGQKVAQVALGSYTGADQDGRQSAYALAMEKLAAEHQILVVPERPDFPMGCGYLARGEVMIPPGHYFVMGDNRDNSNDGRCWGLVPEANLIGRAFMIWMNYNGGIDFGRIGRWVQ